MERPQPRDNFDEGMKSMKLRTKFTLFIVALMTFIIAGISASLFLTQKKLLSEQLEANRNKVFRDFSYTCKEAVVVKDEILVLNTVRSLIETHRPGIVYAGYQSPSGIVLSALRDQNPAAENPFEKRIVQIDTNSEEKFRASSNEEIYEFGIPLFRDNEYMGTIKVGFSQDFLQQEIHKGVMQISRKVLEVSAVALLIGIIFAVLLSAHLNKPIRNLSQAAVKLGEGDLDVQIEVKRKDELGQLSHTFNEMAQKLKELDQLKDSFVSSVSHELRSPLAAIDGYCDFLIEGLEKQMTVEKQKKALTIIKDSTSRLTNFINNILDLAKIKAGKLEIRMIQMSVNEIADEIFTLFGPLAGRDQKQLIVEMPKDFPLINGDPERVKQVVTNLLGNALKFTPQGATVSIIGKKISNDFIEVRIKDTGIGIPPEAVDKVFDKFYQVQDKSGMRKPKGTGLGLAIVAEIVKLHGGDIRCESELGKGTSMIFTLPVWKAAPEGTSTPEAQA